MKKAFTWGWPVSCSSVELVIVTVFSSLIAVHSKRYPSCFVHTTPSVVLSLLLICNDGEIHIPQVILHSWNPHTRNALVNTMNSLFYDWILSANSLPFHSSLILVCHFICTIRTTSPKSVHRNDETTIVCLSAAHPCGFSFCLSAFRSLWMCMRLPLETESVFYWFAITRMLIHSLFIYRFPVTIQYSFHPSSIIDHAFSQCIKSHRSLSLLPLFVDAHCESKDCVIIQHGYDSFLE